MKKGAIIQVRMSSQRFPGKVLHEVAGKTILQYLLERLECCQCLDVVVVATSLEETDIPIAGFCNEYGVRCYRGPLLNVAGRFKEILEIYKFDVFVRISGDSPLLDPLLIEKGMDMFLNGNYEIVTNVLHRSFPKGQSVEVVNSNTFLQSYPEIKSVEYREHVTSFFYKNKERFKINNFASNLDAGGIQLSVDTEDDVKIFEQIVAMMDRPQWQYRWEEILELYHSVVNKAKWEN